MCDLGRVLKQSSKIHVLHGGDSDPEGCMACATYLQHIWSLTIVRIDTRAQLLSFINNPDGHRGLNMLICLGVAIIAEWPEGYNLLRKLKHSTVLVTVPVHTIVHKPYSDKTRMCIVALPSCRQAGASGIVTAAAVYHQDPIVLGKLLDTAVHGQGVCWQLACKPEVTTFLSHTPDETLQDPIERAFWWARTAGAAHEVPAGSFVIIAPSHFPMDIDNPTRKSESTFVFFTLSDLSSLQTIHQGSTYACHFMTTDSGCMTPFWLGLSDCVSHTSGQQRQIVCTARFTKPVRPLVPVAPTKPLVWKTRSGGFSTDPVPKKPVSKLIPLQFV
jgi:hypothetical protein